MVFGQVQWRDCERISRRMLRSEAARLAAGLEEVRERRFMDGVRVSWCEGRGCRGVERSDGGG